MDRKDFLAAIGLSTAAFTLLSCMGCSKGAGMTPAPVPGPSGVNFTLDLSAPANSALNKKGGALATQGIIVAQTLAGAYIAVQQSCTHLSYPLQYDATNHLFLCNYHGSIFSEAGIVERGPAAYSLQVFKTQLTGTMLKITS